MNALHNIYPLVSEKLAILYEMLSDYCKKTTDEYGMKVGVVKKSIPNLGSKFASLQKFSVVLVFRNETDKNS